MRWLFVYVLLTLALLLPEAASGQTPAHLVLARPQATHIRSPYSPAVKVLAQPYPYGYFGACGTTHWQRQFGVYRSYTQWSQK